MRVLHVCPRPGFSGLEAYAFAMAEGQARRGVDVSFVTLEGSPLDKKVRAAGLSTLAITPGFLGSLKALSLIGRLAQGNELANLEGSSASKIPAPDVIHLHSTQEIDFLLLPLLLSRFRGAKRPKVVLQIHIWISHSKRDPLHAISYSLIDEVWCSSRPHWETLHRYLPIPESKLRMMKYGRETAKMDQGFLSREEARNFFKLPSDAVVVGSVARIDQGKGTHELLEAAIDLMARHPRLHLVWVGPPTADDPKAVAFGKAVEARVAGLDADRKSRILLPGSVPDSYKYLKAFDIFALPSYAECFALSLLEAQLAGLPCLATTAGGTPEIVREGQTGWLFEPRSVEGCREALNRALAEESKWHSFGLAGREQVLKNHDFDSNLPRTIEAYEELASLRK